MCVCVCVCVCSFTLPNLANEYPGGLAWGTRGQVTSDFQVEEEVSDFFPRHQGWSSAPGSSGKLEMIEELFHPREGPRSSTHTTSCGVWLPLLKSVGQFLRGCLSQGAVVLAVLALGLVCWPGLGLGLL